MALIERVGPLCLKTGALGVLTLLLLWPLARVRSRIEERRALEQQAQQRIARYRVLDSDDHALLMGSAMAFGALAKLMIATRKLDWSALGSRGA
jgi:inner membrane protein involved in colicin E2 resistance